MQYTVCTQYAVGVSAVCSQTHAVDLANVGGTVTQ